MAPKRPPGLLAVSAMGSRSLEELRARRDAFLRARNLGPAAAAAAVPPHTSAVVSASSKRKASALGGVVSDVAAATSSGIPPPAASRSCSSVPLRSDMPAIKNARRGSVDKALTAGMTVGID
jgi:hypothetical protein